MRGCDRRSTEADILGAKSPIELHTPIDDVADSVSKRGSASPFNSYLPEYIRRVNCGEQHHNTGNGPVRSKAAWRYKTRQMTPRRTWPRLQGGTGEGAVSAVTPEKKKKEEAKVVDEPDFGRFQPYLRAISATEESRRRPRREKRRNGRTVPPRQPSARGHVRRGATDERLPNFCKAPERSPPAATDAGAPSRRRSTKRST